MKLNTPSMLLSLALGVMLTASAAAQDDNKPKPATDATKQANAAWLQRLDFVNKQDFEDAQKGFIEALPGGGVVRNDKGDIVWDPTKFSFIGVDKGLPGHGQPEPLADEPASFPDGTIQDLRPYLPSARL